MFSERNLKHGIFDIFFSLDKRIISYDSIPFYCSIRLHRYSKLCKGDKESLKNCCDHDGNDFTSV